MVAALILLIELQQHLPLAVLKRSFNLIHFWILFFIVATAPTACGIETIHALYGRVFRNPHVATAPTACGIETLQC